MGELSFLITLLVTLQKWLFKLSGEIPLVVLVFTGACLLVSRLMAAQREREREREINSVVLKETVTDMDKRMKA